MTTDSTNMESLDLPDIDPIIQSTKVTSPFLNLPPEVRREIYGILYAIETDADLPPNTNTPKIDLNPLLLCHQVRDEVIEYLLKKYSWIRLTIFHDEINIPYEIKQLPYFPMNLFTTLERARVMSGSTLHIQTSDSTPQIAGKSRDDMLVCHTAASQVIIPEILIATEDTWSPLAVVTIPKESMNRKQSATGDLVLPFARVRGRSSLCRIAVKGAAHRSLENAFENAISNDNACFNDYYEHALALLEEGGRSFGANRYKVSAVDYMDGFKICEEFLDEFTSFQDRPSAEQVKTMRSLRIELANAYGMTSYVALTLSWEEHGALRPEDIHQIANMIDTCYASFEWCGMSNRQRIEAHYRYGVALQVLAEYLSTPNHRELISTSGEAILVAFKDRVPAHLFEDATAQFYYAWQGDVESPVAAICENRYTHLSYKTGFYMLEDP